MTGDAQALPWPDGTFDAVVSCVGVVFAADQQAAARELSRVRATNGVVALIAWQPPTDTDPLVGPALEVLGHPPPDRPSPTDWGLADRVTALLGEDRTTATHPGEHPWHFAGVPQATKLVLDESPLHVGVRNGLTEERRAHFDRAVGTAMAKRSTEDGVRFTTPYLLTTSRLRTGPQRLHL